MRADLGKTIQTSSLEEGLEVLRQKVPKLNGISFGFLDDKFTVHLRMNQPCYGELRKYGPHSTRPQERKPGDLRAPFPRGITPLAVALNPLFQGVRTDLELQEFLVSPSVSPYRSLFKDYEVQRDAKKGVTFILLRDMEQDPTAIVSFFMFIKSVAVSISSSFTMGREQGLTDTEAFFFGMMFRKAYLERGKDEEYGVGNPFEYTIHSTASIRRMIRSDFQDLSGGLTFAKGADYNRPDIHNLFSDPGNPDAVTFRSLAKDIKERFKLGAYDCLPKDTFLSYIPTFQKTIQAEQENA